MIIFNKYNDKGQIVVQAGLEILYRHDGHFSFPASVNWLMVETTDPKVKSTDKYYNFTLNFLCFYLDLQVDRYGKKE